MKAKVLTRFYDTAAKVVHQKGDIIEVTAARFNEITHKGRYIEAYEEAEDKTGKAASADKK